MMKLKAERLDASDLPSINLHCFTRLIEDL